MAGRDVITTDVWGGDTGRDEVGFADVDVEELTSVKQGVERDRRPDRHWCAVTVADRPGPDGGKVKDLPVTIRKGFLLDARAAGQTDRQPNTWSDGQTVKRNHEFQVATFSV